MHENFRSYHLACQLHESCKTQTLPGYAKTQLLRASLSVVLNLSEGSAKRTAKDRRKFYNIAFASLKEVQSIVEIEKLAALIAPADKLGAYVYKLSRA